jgi:hypothetical protein
MVGPIAGPALGGWLTDNYNWRWVFYINLPIGIIAFLGILFFIHETRHARRERFDFFGFGALAIAIGALQMLLDRGELKDWFHSTEIWIEGGKRHEMPTHHKLELYLDEYLDAAGLRGDGFCRRSGARAVQRPRRETF